jgi:4-diphosphocytidyl-2-C-methyl-D-erythritol kinase
MARPLEGSLAVSHDPVPNSRTVVAPAKINLFLRVLGARADGYHDLETAIVPLSLADRLQIHALADPGEFRTLVLSLEVSGMPDIVPHIPADESNLALQAAAALAERAGVKGFADISLHKQIPAAAGLGGGSSDAAATLRALNELWRCGLDETTLVDIGASVGSDVPALLAVGGGGGVVARGRGERVQPVPVRPFRWVLVTFPFGVRTADAFGWWDQEGGDPLGDPGPALEAARRGDAEALGPALFNDLEETVMRRHPEIRQARDQLLSVGAAGAVMCGSGPSVAGLLPEGLTVDLPGAIEVASVT